MFVSLLLTESYSVSIIYFSFPLAKFCIPLPDSLSLSIYISIYLSISLSLFDSAFLSFFYSSILSSYFSSCFPSYTYSLYKCIMFHSQFTFFALYLCVSLSLSLC
jgi:hypothetical protein